MKSRGRPNSGHADLFALFLLFARFMNNRIALGGLRVETFGASRCFSSWVARTNWGANLPQNAGHDPTDLPWSHRGPFGLPRQQGSESDGASQIDLVERRREDPSPR